MSTIKQIKSSLYDLRKFSPKIAQKLERPSTAATLKTSADFNR